MGSRKKIEKNRGRRFCNRGSIKKYRGKGNRGGKGFSGTKKHNKSWVTAKCPEHIGKAKGFVPKNSKEIIVINLGEIEKLAGGKKEIDLGKMGYDKVLGKGNISKAITVKAYTFSRKAQEKIEKAGGKVVAEYVPGEETIEESEEVTEDSGDSAEEVDEEPEEESKGKK